MFLKHLKLPAAFKARYPKTARTIERPKRRRKLLLILFLIFSHLVGALTSVRAIMEVRTAQGTIAWVFALNSVPYVSVPAYWILGRSKFQGYVLARRQDLLQTHPVGIEYRSNLVARGLSADLKHSHNLLTEKLALMPFTDGNDAELLVDGDATFKSIFEGIERAKDYILIEFYIIRADSVGQEMKRRLMEKAAQGVRVYVIYDEIGSAELRGKNFDELESAGIFVRKFHTRQGPNNRWQLNFRNHRKILVVDGQSAWVGGLNVGEEYLGKDPKYGRWRDTHVKVVGPAAQAVQMAFLEDWHWATKEMIPLTWNPQPAPSGKRIKTVALPTGPADELETCTLFMLNAINSATNTLWIATPYFVPDEQFVSALQLAALRGVDVRILVPGKIDNTAVQLSGWSYLPDLERAGIRMSRYTNGLMHQKIMMIDGLHSTISTANFDNRSFRLNFEITMAFADREFSAKVKEMLENDFANSEPVNAQQVEDKGFWYSFAVRCARLMAPIQ